MSATNTLIDTLFLEELHRARRMSPEEKFLAGPRLFAYATRICIEGIRSQHPLADEAEVQRLLRQRLALARRLEEQERSRFLRETAGER